jgi:hypothetical protein
VTNVTFTAVATNLTSPSYSWDLGDGTTGEGPEIMHVYKSPDEYDAKVTARGPEGAPQTSVRVTVRDVTGRWEQVNPMGWKHTLHLEQNRGVISGTWAFVEIATGVTGENPITGELAHPDQFALTTRSDCRSELRGTFDGEVGQLTGEMRNYGATCEETGPWELTFARR